MISYDGLRALAMVVQEKSFAAAAKRLHVTQPAITQRIKSLEEQAGQLLLIREAPPRLTPFGKRMVHHLHEVEALERTLKLPSELSPGDDVAERPLITVGVNADSLATWLFSALSPALQACNFCVEFILEDEDYSFDLLRKREVAGCISTRKKALQGCTVERLGSLRYICVATPTFKRSRLDTHSSLRRALELEPCAAFSRKDDLHERFLQRVLKGKSLSFTTHLLGSNHACFDAVCDDWGWGVVPEIQARDLIKRKGLINLLPDAHEDVVLYWHQWRMQSEVEKQFGSILLERSAKIIRN